MQRLFLARILTTAALALTISPGNLSAQNFAIPKTTVRDSQEISPKPSGVTLWKWSLAAVTVASSLDVASSWGKCEQNNLATRTNGTFSGSQGILLKAGITGGMMAAQWLVTGKTHRYYKLFSALNFIQAGGVTALAAHNYTFSAPASGVCRTY